MKEAIRGDVKEVFMKYCEDSVEDKRKKWVETTSEPLKNLDEMLRSKYPDTWEKHF